MTDDVWVEGVEPGIGDLVLSWDGMLADTVKMSVVRVDLDVDSNYDSNIDADDDPIEMTVGGRVWLNRDDDNGNGIPDDSDTGTVTGEDDLEAINFRLAPSMLSSGTLTLSAVSGAEKIKVWETAGKGTRIMLPKSWKIGVDAVPQVLYVEGVEASATEPDVHLRLRYDSGASEYDDDIKFTVLSVVCVDITDLDPECVCLSKDEKTKKELTVKYKIQPPGYTAMSAQVEILENGTVFRTLTGSSVTGTGEALMSSGEQLDSSRSYTARAVINGDCYSTESDLMFLGPWVIEDMSVGGADDACVPDGVLMFCANTLHESVVSVADEKIEFLAFSWGEDVEIGEVQLPIGGSCWVSGYLGGGYHQECDATKIKIIAECVLNGAISVSSGIVDFDADIQLDDTSKNVFSTSDATYNNQMFFVGAGFENISAGNHIIHIKFKGNTSAVGKGSLAATEFNDRYDDGYFIEVKKITIECEECSCD